MTKNTRVSGFSGSQAHSYTASTTGLNAQGYVYKMTYAGGSYFIKEGYKIPLFTASSLSLSKYILNEASRQSLISIDSRATSSVPTALMTEHDTQTSDLTNIKPQDLPPVPTITTSSPTSITTNPDGSLEALDSITFTIGNKSADCEYSLYLDGVALAEGTPVVRAGAHTVTAVAKSKYNYTVAVKALKFEVRNPNFILPPRITFAPLYNHSGSKTITVTGGSSLYGELETSTLEYKLSTDNVWKPYSSPVVVTEPLTFTARKTNQYGQSISTDLIISSAMITPLPVITPNLSHMKTSNGLLAIPAIDQAIGADYTVKVDGYTYTSWSAVRPPNSSSSTVSVVATNRRTGVASSPVTKTINFNLDPAPQYTIPGLQSSLKMIKLSASTPLQLNKADAVADVYIDGQKVEIGQPMFTPSTVNGVHTILIISRNPVNYAIATTSYVININNYSTADTSYSTTANKRTALLPLNREAGIYDTPGEIMVDTRTGDLSVVGKNLQPIEITKELRDQINSKDQIIGQVNKTIEYISSDTGALSSTLESLFGSTGIRTITDLTDRISSEIVTYQPKLNTAISSLTQTASDIAALKANLTSNSGTLTSGATSAKSSSQTILSTTYPASLNTLSANTLALLDNLTEVAQDTYNLTTINNIANGKVTTAEYTAFYKKNDQIFSSLQTIVNNF